MAFEKKNAGNNTVAKFNKSADGFINLDIIMADGSTQRIGGVALHSNKRLHERLLELGELDGLNLQLSMNVITDTEELDFASVGPSSVDEQIAEELQQQAN